MVEVVATDEFRDWYLDLDEQGSEAVYRAVSLLEVKGVTLPFQFGDQRLEVSASGAATSIWRPTVAGALRLRFATASRPATRRR